MEDALDFYLLIYLSFCFFSVGRWWFTFLDLYRARWTSEGENSWQGKGKFTNLLVVKSVA